MQTFRIGVELLLHRLSVDGLAPRIVTYQGGNIEILIGLSAPLIAWISTRGRRGERVGMIWANIRVKIAPTITPASAYPILRPSRAAR